MGGYFFSSRKEGDGMVSGIPTQYSFYLNKITPQTEIMSFDVTVRREIEILTP